MKGWQRGLLQLAPTLNTRRCETIHADGSPCKSKTPVTANVNKTGKLAMFQNMQKPFCQTCLMSFKRYAAHCICVACTVLVTSGSVPYVGSPFARCYVCSMRHSHRSCHLP